jgi:hypothetical protein
MQHTQPSSLWRAIRHPVNDGTLRQRTRIAWWPSEASPPSSTAFQCAHHRLDRFRGHRPGNELIEEFVRDFRHGKLFRVGLARLVYRRLVVSDMMPRIQKSGQGASGGAASPC